MGELMKSIIAQATCNLAQARQYLPVPDTDDSTLISFSPALKHVSTLSTFSSLLSSDALELLSQFATDLLISLQNSHMVYTEDVFNVINDVFSGMSDLLQQVQEPGFDESVFLSGAEALCEQAEMTLERARELARRQTSASAGGVSRPVSPLPEDITGWLSRCGNPLICEVLFASLASAQAVKVVIYRPDADCFFRGEDPYAIASACPGVIDFRVSAKPHMEGPDDVFLCHMDLMILCIADDQDLTDFTSPLHEQTEVFTVSVYQLFPYCCDIIREALRTDDAELLNDMLALQDAQQVACVSGFLHSACEPDSDLAAVYAGIEQMALEPASLERFQHLLSFNPTPMEAEAFTLISLDSIHGEPVDAMSSSHAETQRATIKALLEQQKMLVELMIAGDQDTAALAVVQCAVAAHLSLLLNPSDDTEEAL